MRRLLSPVRRTAAFLPLLLVLLVLLVWEPAAARATTFHVQAGPDLSFSPADLTIQAGDTVTWTNAGGTHNVVANDGSFRCAAGCDGEGGSGDLSGAAWSFSRTFGQPGVVAYFCELHAGMNGTVTVAASSPGTLRFNAVSFSGGEGTEVAVAVARTGGTAGEVSVAYATGDGSALAGVDYTPASGTITFADGEGGVKAFGVGLLADDSAEGSESFAVTLSAPTGGAVLANPATATVLVLEGGSGGGLTEAQVACDGRRLSGLLARMAATAPRNTKATSVDLAFTRTGDFAGIAATGNGPGTPEHHLAFSTNPEETTLQRNPERPQLPAISLTRNAGNSDLVPAGNANELRLALNTTLSPAPPEGDLLRIDNLSGAAARPAGARPGRGLGPLLDPCHGELSERDVHVFRVLSKLARARAAGASAYELAIYRAEAADAYRVDVYPLATGGAPMGERLAVEIAVTFSSRGELAGGTMRVLPRCSASPAEGCTSVTGLAELVLLRPVPAGRIAPESPYRVSTRGVEGDAQPEHEVDWADLLAGTSWKRPL